MDLERRLYLRLFSLCIGEAMEILLIFIEKCVLHHSDFESFLNLLKNKHKLFHKWSSKTPCCECLRSVSSAAPNKRSEINKTLLKSIYKLDGSEVGRHVKRNSKGHRIQHCICKMQAITGITTKNLDFTLLRCLVKTCDPTAFSKVERPIEVIHRVRNDLVHSQNCKMTELEFNNKWKVVVYAVLAIENEVNTSRHTKESLSQLKSMDVNLRNIVGKIDILGKKTLNFSLIRKKLLDILQEKKNANKLLMEKILEKIKQDNVKALETQKERFHLLSIHCDGILVDCIVDKRMHRKYYHLYHDMERRSIEAKFNETEFYIENRKADSAISDITSSFSDFEKLYTFSKTRQTDELKLLEIAMKNGQDLVCRWLLSHTSDSELVFALHPMKHIPAICRILSWTCTKLFHKQYASSLTKCLIWPGTKCKCKKEEYNKQICFKRSSLVIVVESETKVCELPSKFGIFKIHHITPAMRSKATQESAEILKKQNDNKSHYMNKSVSGEDAEKLFNKHRNLTLLCPYPFKSQGYHQNHIVTSKVCLQMLCRLKGIIPIGENHFPSDVDGMETDVLEGCPRLTMEKGHNDDEETENSHNDDEQRVNSHNDDEERENSHNDDDERENSHNDDEERENNHNGDGEVKNMQVGNTIGTSGTSYFIGTLGGFCSYMGKQCFLTCAHVMYDMTELLTSHNYAYRNKRVDSFVHTPDGPPMECGRIIRRVFDHDNAKTTSIDAALVEINDKFFVNLDEFILDINGEPRSFVWLLGPEKHLMYLEDNCLDHLTIMDNHLPLRVYAVGAETKYSSLNTNDNNDANEIQAQESSGINKHIVLSCVAHCRISESPEHNYKMFNQCCINIDTKKGDSGTCIYMNDPYGCVGMVIGGYPGHSIVTPLKEILSRL